MVCLKLHHCLMLILLIIAYLIVNEEPNTFISVLFGKWISGGSPFFKKIISTFCATCYVLSRFNCVRLCNLMDFRPPCYSVHGFSRQEYWSGLPHPPPGDLPDLGIESTFLMSPSLAGGFFTTSTTWEAPAFCNQIIFRY